MRKSTSKALWIQGPIIVPGIPRSEYHLETAFQVYCATYLRKQFVLTGNKGYNLWHHSANEREGARAGFMAKMMGQSKGFPDFVSIRLRAAIELKIPGKLPRPEQILWKREFEDLGWFHEFVYSFEHFRDIVERLVKK